MNEIEVRARTVDQAVSEALSTLGVTRSQVEV